MKKNSLIKLLAIFLALSMVACSSRQADISETTVAAETQPPEATLSEEELLMIEKNNSVSMLNYLMVLSQEIIVNKDNRIFLEDAYSSLVNNINPELVDDNTLQFIQKLLDIIEKARMVDVKRERILFIYEQHKAQAIYNAIPNPFEIENIVDSIGDQNWFGLAVAATATVTDLFVSAAETNDIINEEYIRSGWELSDEEAENIHTLRREMFSYMTQIVRDYGISEELILNEEDAKRFALKESETNATSRLKHYLDSEDTYKGYSNYWLVLAHSYFECEKYEECLSAILKYQSVQGRIFRKDYKLAKALPEAILAASYIYNEDKYVEVALEYLETILKNSDSTDWALRYFAACKYLEIYGLTNDAYYLKHSYEILSTNVNELRSKQIELNSKYLADVKEVEVPKDATKDDKGQIEDYNDLLNTTRKTELAPVYEPLAVNLDLYFLIAEELQITNAEKEAIEKMLRDNGSRLFLSEPIEIKYSFGAEASPINGKLKAGSLSLPVTCLTESSSLRVTVTDGGKDTVYEDWKLKEVKREGDTVDTFMAVFTQSKYSNRKWSSDAVIKVEIFESTGCSTEPQVITFKIKKYDDNWIFDDSVSFEQVT